MTDDRTSHDPWAPPPTPTALTGVGTPDDNGQDWPDLDETEPPAQAGDPQAAATEIPDNLTDIGKDDLIALAELAGVATYGTKAALADRIRDAARAT